MARLRVVLVEPLYGGNIGHTARTCANFGIDDLVLVRGPAYDEEAYDRAVHAKPLLESARRVDDLDAALEGAHLVAAFSSRISKTPHRHLRKPIALPDLAERIARLPAEATVALLFGREDAGLTNEEVRRAELIVAIPTHPAYPSMNLSHAVTAVLYELAGRSSPRPIGPEQPAVEPHEREILYAVFRDLLEATNYPEHKREATWDLFRNLMGRTFLSKWEYHTLMGVFTTTLWHFGKSYANYGDRPDFQIPLKQADPQPRRAATRRKTR